MAWCGCWDAQSYAVQLSMTGQYRLSHLLCVLRFEAAVVVCVLSSAVCSAGCSRRMCAQHASRRLCAQQAVAVSLACVKSCKFYALCRCVGCGSQHISLVKWCCSSGRVLQRYTCWVVAQGHWLLFLMCAPSYLHTACICSACYMWTGNQSTFRLPRG
jgi:hypothetical protein